MTPGTPLSAAAPADRRTLLHKAATLAHLPRFTIVWLVPGIAVMGLAAAAFAVIPFARLAAVFGDPAGAVGIVPLTNAGERKRAAQIAHLVAVVARIAPFRRDCVPQALLALFLCRLYRVPAALHFGVRWSTDVSDAPPALAAHAWLASAPRIVAGGASFADHIVTACFVSPRGLLAKMAGQTGSMRR